MLVNFTSRNTLHSIFMFVFNLMVTKKSLKTRKNYIKVCTSILFQLTHSKLASRLVDRGVINKEVLEKLRVEWQDELAKKGINHDGSDEDMDSFPDVSYSEDDYNGRR